MLGVLLDMDDLTIAWSFDGVFYPKVQLPKGLSKLYPAVSFIWPAEWVTIDFSPPLPQVNLAMSSITLAPNQQ
jgi:hypothetical protein